MTNAIVDLSEITIEECKALLEKIADAKQVSTRVPESERRGGWVVEVRLYDHNGNHFANLSRHDVDGLLEVRWCLRRRIIRLTHANAATVELTMRRDQRKDKLEPLYRLALANNGSKKNIIDHHYHQAWYAIDELDRRHHTEMLEKAAAVTAE